MSPSGPRLGSERWSSVPRLPGGEGLSPPLPCSRGRSAVLTASLTKQKVPDRQRPRRSCSFPVVLIAAVAGMRQNVCCLKHGRRDPLLRGRLPPHWGSGPEGSTIPRGWWEEGAAELVGAPQLLQSLARKGARHLCSRSIRQFRHLHVELHRQLGNGAPRVQGADRALLVSRARSSEPPASTMEQVLEKCQLGEGTQGPRGLRGSLRSQRAGPQGRPGQPTLPLPAWALPPRQAAWLRLEGGQPTEGTCGCQLRDHS